MTRMDDAPGHVWDRATSTCTKCGQRWLALLDRPPEDRACTTGQNVVGITHLIARRRMREVWAEFRFVE